MEISFVIDTAVMMAWPRTGVIQSRVALLRADFDLNRNPAQSRYSSRLDIWRAAEMWNVCPRTTWRPRCPFEILKYMNTTGLTIIASKFDEKVGHPRLGMKKW